MPWPHGSQQFRCETEVVWNTKLTARDAPQTGGGRFYFERNLLTVFRTDL